MQPAAAESFKAKAKPQDASALTFSFPLVRTSHIWVKQELLNQSSISITCCNPHDFTFITQSELRADWTDATIRDIGKITIPMQVENFINHQRRACATPGPYSCVSPDDREKALGRVVFTHQHA